MAGSRRLVLALVALLSLVVAACGTHLSDEERALYANAALNGGGGTGTGQPTGVGPGTSTGISGDAGSTTGDDAGSTSDQAAGASETGDGSTGEVTADDGAAPGAGQPAATGDACARTANGAPGVTADAITLGGVFQLSGAVPGFAQTAVDGANAYANYVNATGGLCGRQLRFSIADDAFDASKHRAELQRLEPSVLAYAAGYSTVDAGGVEFLEQSGIPNVGIAASVDKQVLPNHFSHLVSRGLEFTTPNPEHAWLASQGATKVAMVYAGIAAARDQIAIQKRSFELAGLKIVLDQEVAPTQFSYAAPARAVKDSDADVMLFVHDITAMVQMADELAKIGADVAFPVYFTAYGPAFVERAGKNAEGAVAFIETLPFTETGNEEMSRFLEWLQRTVPGSRPTFESVNAWIHMKLIVEAIRGIDGDVTRDSLLGSLRSILGWDAGGMVNPVDIGNKTSDNCKIAVRVSGGGWKREAPAQGFLC